jgi:hypothetical protein
MTFGQSRLHESEAAAFARKVECGRDVFKSEYGQRYYDGCTDAIRGTVELVECVIESDRKRDEWLEHNRGAVGSPPGQLPESFEQALQRCHDESQTNLKRAAATHHQTQMCVKTRPATEQSLTKKARPISRRAFFCYCCRLSALVWLRLLSSRSRSSCCGAVCRLLRSGEFVLADELLRRKPG